jgi:hypothetical protein
MLVVVDHQYPEREFHPTGGRAIAMPARKAGFFEENGAAVRPAGDDFVIAATDLPSERSPPEGRPRR